jgi:hypothetical protein
VGKKVTYLDIKIKCVVIPRRMSFKTLDFPSGSKGNGSKVRKNSVDGFALS